MTKHTIRHTAQALLLATLLVLTGCTGRPKKYVIGVSQCSMDSWREKFIDEMKNMALLTDSVTLTIAVANDDDHRQEAQIDSMANQGVDLLIVSPNQLSTISAAVDRAVARGIPVILYDRKTDSEKYTAFIGCDNHQIGMAMGQYIAQQLDGHGRVAEIKGLQGSSPAIERHQGFVDALKAYPDITLVASESGDWKEESGRKAMATLLRQTRDIDYVFAHNDRMAIGAQKEAERQRLAKQPKCTGVDALATAGGGLELVRDGKLDASYLYPTRGHEVIALAMKVLTGKPFERENHLQTSIVTRDNATLSLMEAKDTERQRQDLSTLHRQVDGYVAQYESQKMLTVTLLVILALVVAIVVLVYRSLVVKQRLTQEVVELNQSRLVFFTNISHELRTPLTLIADPVQLLLEDSGIKGRSRELLMMVQRNALSLQQLVGFILDFRKIQNGKMTLAPSAFDIVEALRTWTDDFKVSAQHREVTLSLDTTAYTASPTVVADKEKVARIMFNLLSNALKYTPKGGEIRVTLQDAPASALRIRVQDTGRGIPKEDADKVFERFFQAKGANGGTGIGLALVKAFAEMHHGTATVESEEGRGTVFQVTLPRLTKAADTQSVTEEERKALSARRELATATSGTNEAETAQPAPPTPPEKPRILVIDDNDDVRLYLRTVLGDRYAVLEAADGSNGLDVAQAEVPDLVVCDVMMPVMDGLTFCHRLKTTTSTSHIPVIMLTAKAMDEHRVEGYEQGADSYITKPFQSKVLLARIGNLLRQRTLLREHFAATSLPLPAAQPQPSTANAPEQPQAEAEQPKPALAPREQAFLNRVNGIIDAHLSDSDFNVEAIGQEIGLSRVQLYRKVKALTGTSVVDLLRRARLNRARQLLTSCDRTISEVAYDTGFSSPSYFAKCFKEEFGLTPGECVAKG